MSDVLDALDMIARARSLNRMFIVATARPEDQDDEAFSTLAGTIDKELEQARALLRKHSEELRSATST